MLGRNRLGFSYARKAGRINISQLPRHCGQSAGRLTWLVESFHLQPFGKLSSPFKKSRLRLARSTLELAGLSLRVGDGLGQRVEIRQYRASTRNRFCGEGLSGIGIGRLSNLESSEFRAWRSQETGSLLIVGRQRSLVG